jgi:hypothetical protein
MKSDIVGKLSRELEDEIVSERQVVYILVETRKLLEQQTRLDDFRTLTLCSNWTVHPKLDRKDSQEVLKYFDAYEAEYQNSRLTVAEFQHQQLHDFMTFKSFRSELFEALSSYGVETSALTEDKAWQSFIQHYTSVIRDCPLEAKNGKTQLVSHVTALCWPEEMAGSTFPGKRVVQWNWTLKSGIEREKNVCALI